MKKLAKILAIVVATLLLCAAIIAAELLNGALIARAQASFGLKDFSVGAFNEDGSPARQAGSHPFALTTSFEVNTKLNAEEEEIPDGQIKDARFYLPPGLIGSRTAVPQCTTAEFLTIDEARPACPDNTAIGYTKVRVINASGFFIAAVYNLVPPPGVAAKLGFVARAGVPVTAEIGINGEEPNELVGSALNIVQAVNFFSAELTIWGIPAAHSHDPFRGRCLDKTPNLLGEPVSEGICDTGAAEVPFLTLPRSCTGPLESFYELVSWQDPDAEPVEGSAQAPGMTGCSKLGFGPKIAAKPTTSSAESASGLDFEIDINDEGINNPTGLANSDVEDLAVAMPAGMTLNPSAANGLSTCSEEAYEAEALGNQSCPEASKIGEIEVQSPILAKGETLKGAVYLAEQGKNPFESLLALYVVIKDPVLGVLVKRAGVVEPEEGGPNAGQIFTVFEGFPQVPFSHLHFRFTEGARAPLITPPTCGTYATEAEFFPWAAPEEPLLATASFDISSGVNGGPCPAGGVPPFTPHFEAGSLNNNAGAYSPFQMRLTRSDGEQEMTRFDAVLPKGMSAKLAGLGRCPESAIALAKAKSGREEIANPSCPANSQIGTTLAGAGVGGVLTYVPGRLYMGGPFAGDPLSVIAITPDVAGPFDVGTTVVHEALAVDPETAEVKVDGAHSDPIPHILKGIPLKLRDLRVITDRPNFTLNPTSCARKEAKATLFGSFLDVFSSADDQPANLSARYQAASCASLKFKPKLALKLKGGTKRGAHPALRATVTYPPGAGYANTAKAVVTLPHSEFLEQSHIRTVCTRVQFAAAQCPPGSIYGHARAFSPILDEPEEGPVYLRSSNHPLPDLVLALHGLLDFNAVGRIDSRNARIRTSFETVPDVPLSKVVLEMQGDKKGLLVNSRDLCAGDPAHALSVFTAQSGKVFEEKPVVKAGCGGKGRRG
jgi:hypothetical protein